MPFVKSGCFLVVKLFETLVYSEHYLHIRYMFPEYCFLFREQSFHYCGCFLCCVKVNMPESYLSIFIDFCSCCMQRFLIIFIPVYFDLEILIVGIHLVSILYKYGKILGEKWIMFPFYGNTVTQNSGRWSLR